jgi:hypothetical protein
MSSLPAQLIVGSLLVLGFGAIVVSFVQNYRRAQQPPLSDTTRKKKKKKKKRQKRKLDFSHFSSSSK